MIFEDRYSPTDRLLHRIAFRAGIAQEAMADVENALYGDTLEAISVGEPTFITALPRAGTTILLKLLWATDRFASHVYRDMPFVMCPMLWYRLARRFTVEDAPRERAHGDGIQVSAGSPEAFDEMIWKHFWPGHYRADRILPWTDDGSQPEFGSFFVRHMKKIVALRRDGPSDTRRYLSKNNVNIARLAAPPHPLDTGTFLVLFRKPLQHAASMLRQHRRFLKIHDESPFTLRYMTAIGHHEFGRDLRPIDFHGWLDGAPSPESLEFWVRYWTHAYRHAFDNLDSSTHLVSYEQLTIDPQTTLSRLARAVAIPAQTLLSQTDRLQPPRKHPVDEDELSEGVREEASEIYARLRDTATAT